MITSESEQIKELANKILAQASDLKKLNALLNTEITKNSILSSKILQSEEILRLKDNNIYNLHQKIDELNEIINKLQASISWRLTKPLRESRSQVAKITNSKLDGKFLRLLLLFWWTLTLKLGKKLQQEKVLATLTKDYIELIRNSEYFDKDWYLQQNPDLLKVKIDPAEHYFLFGFKEGRDPGPLFDNYWYLTQNPDVADSGINPLIHFILEGQKEGRTPNSIQVMQESNDETDTTHDSLKLKNIFKVLNPDKENILVVSHDATRSGAPVLTYNVIKQLKQKYNVIVLLLEAGDLTEFFRDEADLLIGPYDKTIHDSVQLYTIIDALNKTYNIAYAMVNSIASNSVLDPLSRNNIPTVSLIHEYASCIHKPEDVFGRVRDFSNEIIFSTTDTMNTAIKHCYGLEKKSLNILPQGLCNLPDEEFAKNELERQRIKNALRPIDDDTILVVGCGTVYLRKGIDIFINTASRVVKKNPDLHIKFIWFGNTYNPEEDMDYSAFLANQIERSDLTDKMIFFGEVTSMDAVFECADIFYLSSRLDPLPNVAIQAMMAGLPVVCFDKAGGIPDLLKSNKITQDLVLPHLDDYAASEIILQLSANRNLRHKFGQELENMAKATFDIKHYAESIDKLGIKAKQAIEQRKIDFETIKQDKDFNQQVFLAPYVKNETKDRDVAIRRFVYQWAVNYQHRRKPCSGFNPQIYQYLNNIYDENPFAHYIRAGKPDGAWKHEVLKYDESVDLTLTASLTAALHAHFYYVDLIDEFMQALKVNKSKCDLFISTCSDSNKQFLENATKGYDAGNVYIKVVENIGRDLKPFLTDFKNDLMKYDIIGHVHAKKSVDASQGYSEFGVIWQQFLWQNLLGDKYPMMDLIFSRLATSASTGMVFPDDPNLINWTKNLAMASELANKMQLKIVLPRYFNFPVGSMFWARADVLKPIFNLNLTTDDYPIEPVPLDATILHSIERLFPLVSEDLGYQTVLTYVPGYIR